MKVIYMILLLFSFPALGLGQERVQWDVVWYNVNQPYGEETDSIVISVHEDVRKQFLFSSRLDFNLTGFSETPLYLLRYDGCAGGFVTLEQYADLAGKKVEDVTASASAFGLINTVACVTVYEETSFEDIHYFSGTALHEWGHTLGMIHPSKSDLPLNERYRGESIMWYAGGQYLINNCFTLYDNIQIAELGWGIDPNNANVVATDAVFCGGDEDLTLYIPLVEVGGPGGEEAWVRFRYEGTTFVTNENGQLEERYQFGFDPDLLKEAVVLPNGLTFSPAVSAYGYVKDLVKQEEGAEVPWYDKYHWDNPATFYEQSGRGILEIPTIRDSSGIFGDMHDVVLFVKDMNVPLNDLKFVVQTVSGTDFVVK